MALGGGSFTEQNKVLPGVYANFVSVARATPALSDRGIATMPLELDWGREGEVFEVTREDFEKDSVKIFGYGREDDRMKGIRDLFMGASTLYAYRLNVGGTKASNNFAVALYGGVRGNDLKTIIQATVDNPGKYEVKTLLGSSEVDSQVVSSAQELEANDYVSFKEDTELAVTASTPLSGGTNGTVDGMAHKAYQEKIESYAYNTMGVVVTDEVTKNMYAAFNGRMREEFGIKSQLVLHNLAADYLGVINVKNKVTDEGWSEASLIYWVTGAQSGCAVNKSCQNKAYNGSFAVEADYSQEQLKKCLEGGEFVLHKVNSEIRVLEDINSMVTTTDDCGDVFKDNQTIRVIDQIGNDDAVLFNEKYNGKVPNDDAGRISLWSDLVKIRQELQKMRAIENFSDSDVTIEAGEGKKSVVVNGSITVTNTMSKLYITTQVG